MFNRRLGNTMEWLKSYGWIILVALLVGFFLNGIRDLKKINYARYLEKRQMVKNKTSKKEKQRRL